MTIDFEGSLRETLLQMAEYARPGDDVLAKMMSNAADTAEQIAFRILTDARPQSSLGSGTP